MIQPISPISPNYTINQVNNNAVGFINVNIEGDVKNLTINQTNLLNASGVNAYQNMHKMFDTWIDSMLTDIVDGERNEEPVNLMV